MSRISLSKLLEVAGVKKVEELSPEEQDTYERYRKVLSGENLTLDNVKEFCQSQIRLIEEKFALNPRTDDDIYLKACLHVYLNIVKAIDAPQMERELLEKHLEQLIKNSNGKNK